MEPCGHTDGKHLGAERTGRRAVQTVQSTGIQPCDATQQLTNSTRRHVLPL